MKDPRIASIYSMIRHIKAQAGMLHDLVTEELLEPFSIISCDSLLKIQGFSNDIVELSTRLKPVLEEFDGKLRKIN